MWPVAVSMTEQQKDNASVTDIEDALGGRRAMPFTSHLAKGPVLIEMV